MNKESINLILKDGVGSISHNETLFNKAKSDLHLSSVLTLINTVNNYLSEVEIDYTIFEPKLDIYPRHDRSGKPYEAYISISFQDNTNNPEATAFFNENKLIINKNDDLINEITNTIFIEFIDYADKHMISIPIDTNSEGNCQKIINILLTNEQKNQLNSIILENELKTKVNNNKKIKI